MPIEAPTKASRPWISNGRRELALNALREVLGVGGLPDVMDQEHELVAAEARDRVARAQRGAQPAADLLEQRVAEAVPPAVVDPLEAIEIQEEDGERPAPVRVRRECAPAPSPADRGTAPDWASPVSES